MASKTYFYDYFTFEMYLQHFCSSFYFSHHVKKASSLLACCVTLQLYHAWTLSIITNNSSSPKFQQSKKSISNSLKSTVNLLNFPAVSNNSLRNMDGFAEVISYQYNSSTERCGIVHWLCVLQFFSKIQLFHWNIYEFLSHFYELFNRWLPLLWN